MTGFRGILLSLVLSVILFLQIHSISAITGRGFSCDDPGTSTPAFNANLKTILATAPKNINAYGFYNGTAGTGNDQVYAMALCRGDDDVSLCIKCVIEAGHTLTRKYCPNKNDGIAWYDECMFKYSGGPYSGLSIEPIFYQVNNKDAPNATSFSQAVASFADSIIAPASKGSFRKYAVKKNSNPTIYGYMQCTPDLTTSDCTTCLNAAVDVASSDFSRIGAKAFTPSCFFRYEINPFINNTSH